MDPQAEWRKLLGSAPDVERPRSLIGIVADADDELMAGALLGAVETIVYTLVCNEDGPFGSSLLEPLPPLLERARRVSPADMPLGGLGMTACAVLLASVGADDDPRDVLAPWAPRAIAEGPDLGDNDRTTYALACAALGFDEAVHELVGEPPVTYEPNASFGPDARTYARYLVAAAAAGAPPNEIARSWTSFVSYFPVRLETRGLTWSDLLFAGYGTYARVVGNEPGEVMGSICTFVRDLVEQ